MLGAGGSSASQSGCHRRLGRFLCGWFWRQFCHHPPQHGSTTRSQFVEVERRPTPREPTTTHVRRASSHSYAGRGMAGGSDPGTTSARRFFAPGCCMCATANRRNTRSSTAPIRYRGWCDGVSGRRRPGPPNTGHASVGHRSWQPTEQAAALNTRDGRRDAPQNLNPRTVQPDNGVRGCAVAAGGEETDPPGRTKPTHMRRAGNGRPSRKPPKRRDPRLPQLRHLQRQSTAVGPAATICSKTRASDTLA